MRVFRFDAAAGLPSTVDSFSFYAWARQALGPVGIALGWTPIVRGKVQREARAGLDEFVARDG